MTNDWILYVLLTTVGVISFGWLLVAANRASREEREWLARLKRAAREHQEQQNENGAV